MTTGVDIESDPDEVEAEAKSAYTKAEQKHYQSIRDKEREVADCEADFTAKKESASAAKKRFEAADEQLRAFIRRGPDLQQNLPGMDIDVDSEAWRDVALVDLDVPADIRELLRELLVEAEEPRLLTIGDLQSYLEEYALTDIGGIGPAKAEVIESRLADFWEAHPEYCQPERKEDDEEDEEPAQDE